MWVPLPLVDLYYLSLASSCLLFVFTLRNDPAHGRARWLRHPWGECSVDQRRDGDDRDCPCNRLRRRFFCMRFAAKDANEPFSKSARALPVYEIARIPWKNVAHGW